MKAADRAPTKSEMRRRRRMQRERFLRSKRSTQAFERQLRGVAENIGKIIHGFAPDGVVENETGLRAMLRRYSEVLDPWARAVTSKMIAEVSQQNEKAWSELGAELGRNLKQEIQRAPAGHVFQQMMQEQVTLIKSLPLKASQRVHELTIESFGETGARASEIAKEIMRSGHVTKSRATLIARTESARTAGAMTEARAKFVGAEGYIWRTANDSDVRHRHKELEGKFIRYDDPPVAGERGERAHAGMIYNCRCWQEPVIPDLL